MNANILKTIFIPLAIVLISTATVSAAGVSECQPIYGGGESCPPAVTFTIDKKVQTPGKGGQFVDNITINDAKFAPGQDIVFQITVTNTSKQKNTNIKVVDTLPDFLTFVSGPGTVDENKKVVTYVIESLEAGKFHTATIVAKAASENLPSDKGIICVTNQAQSQKDALVAKDVSQVCIEKQVLGAVPTPSVFPPPPMKVTPPTGPEMLVLPLLGGSGLLGWFLRKKSR